MSMFHELMMRKKEQIMYATIKGTLTENDGVFSGFSASSYLQLQQNLDSDFEMVIDFTTGDSIIGGRVVFMNRSVFDLEVYGSGLVSFNWQNSTYNSVIPSTDYSATTNYKVKIIKNGSTISFSYSKNGGAYISTATFTTTKTVSNPATFGTSPVETSRYFNGSINLNQSYIKLGSTKYNLQAVVGYTIVGSPTIVDGVVSGFSSANYLKINVPTTINYNTLELGIKFKTSSASVNQRLFFSLNNLLYSVASNILSLNYFNSSSSFSSKSGGSISNDVLYWFKITFDIVKKVMIVDKSTDGINYTNYATYSNLTNINSSINISTNGFFFCNTDNNQYTELGISNTYIKINNKLWFNGQPA